MAFTFAKNQKPHSPNGERFGSHKPILHKNTDHRRDRNISYLLICFGRCKIASNTGSNTRLVTVAESSVSEVSQPRA